MQGRPHLDPERLEAGLLVEMRHQGLTAAELVGRDTADAGEIEVEQLVTVARPAKGHGAVHRLDETLELILPLSRLEAERVLAPGNVRVQERRLDSKELAELILVRKRVHVILARE